ncbi:MAG: polymer-forming cytoskeletal protein [Rhodospirillaceae bacterium]|nr:polymer-forming cytoskeletal protein [Rhodospirillaceae bacterium]MBL6931076.1 polymer-forming cytoskeletal protein [Rhodospirillales bacterium]MBL6941858.1 polymer-forming cytoskeletal protein [Rhodospirillales bacterium]
MFSRNNKNASKPGDQKQAQTVKPAVPSIISADLKMTGDLNSDGEIQVDGTIVGDIRTKTLLIGKSANIKGEIFADNVRVHGNVNGQIKARSVILAKTAHVIGDILHEDLSIETGAFLEGLCKRMTGSQLADSAKINLIEGNAAPAALESDTKKTATAS